MPLSNVILLISLTFNTLTRRSVFLAVAAQVRNQVIKPVSLLLPLVQQAHVLSRAYHLPANRPLLLVAKNHDVVHRLTITRQSQRHYFLHLAPRQHLGIEHLRPSRGRALRLRVADLLNLAFA